MPHGLAHKASRSSPIEHLDSYVLLVSIRLFELVCRLGKFDAAGLVLAASGYDHGAGDVRDRKTVRLPLSVLRTAENVCLSCRLRKWLYIVSESSKAAVLSGYEYRLKTWTAKHETNRVLPVQRLWKASSFPQLSAFFCVETMCCLV